VITGPGRYQAEDLALLARLAEAGRLRAVVESTYGLDDIVAAHRLVDSGRKRGSVVVRIGIPTAAPRSAVDSSSALDSSPISSSDTEGHPK
jgi:hypothetical protein